MTPVTVIRGTVPVVLGLPHAGTDVPKDIADQLNEAGRRRVDTDWHVDRLYEGLLTGATVVRANFHRYVIDANRDPAGHSLYPGQNTTSLVPLTDFDGNCIWQSEPTQSEVAARRAAFHQPYHAALATEVQHVHDRHGVAILYDCHSIRSRIPFLFDGVLPDFNIGTNLGTTCHNSVAQRVIDLCQQAHGYTTVVDGRFKGGWTTRHYGRPEDGFHAIQMELAQSTYLTEEAAPWTLDAAKAARLRPHLAAILMSLAALAPTLRGSA